MSTTANAWIIDAERDRTFIFGGVLASVLLVSAFLISGGGIALWWWVWVLLLDGPHIFATLARTYLDPEEWRSRGRLLWGSLLWLAAGPLFLLLSWVADSPQPTYVFHVLAGIWAYWHILRQHLGFLTLYKRRAGEVDPLEERWDRATLYVGTLAPFAAFVLLHPQARRLMGLGASPTWEGWAAAALGSAAGITALAWALRQLHRARRGQAPSRQKVAYLGLLLGFTALLFCPPVVGKLPLTGVTIAVTAWHNVQYHALVWFYKQNRYRLHPERHGWAAVVGRHLWLYALSGVVFTLAYRIVGCSLGSTPGCTASTAPLFAGISLPMVGESLFWGVALHHYFVDQYIWRPSRDSRLRSDLRLSQA